MLDQVQTIFTDAALMMRKLKKKSYEVNMNSFRQQHGHYLEEMRDYASSSEDVEGNIAAIAEVFCQKVSETYFNKRGKVPSRIMVDLDMFMIYYVFPAILLLKDDNSKAICDALCAKWNETFKEKISYADYDTIYGSFREKIFGIF